jgi:hypothetical protein
MTLTVSCVIAFYAILWWITLRELKSQYGQNTSSSRYLVTSLYFWIGFLLTCTIIGFALRFMMLPNPTV